MLNDFTGADRLYIACGYTDLRGDGSGRMRCTYLGEVNAQMKLKKHGAELVNFVISFSNGAISRRDFDLDYSYYVKKNFPAFTRGRPGLSSRFADTIDQTYDTCSYMADEDFQDAIADAVDEFWGNAPEADIF